MRLALHTDYALRVLMYLAGAQSRCTVGEIAQFFGISRDHVAKVVQRLTKAGFSRSIKGVGGGLELAKDPANIRVGEVIEAIEGNMHLLECVCAETEVCRIQQRCRLRGVLAEAERVQMEYLNSVVLTDVVKPGRHIEALLN